MSAREFLDLSYVGEGGDERQTYDLFLPAETSRVSGAKWPLLVFVHGGAWRSGSKSDHRDMARHLASSSKIPTAVALIEYRLSLFTSPSDGSSEKTIPPTIFHPSHQSDVQAALSHILHSSSAKGSEEYDSSDVVLVGHSVGAFMALGVALEGEKARDTGAPKAQEIAVWEKEARSTAREAEILPLMPATAQHVRKAIGTYVCVDGIYSLPHLLTRYPSYATFVYQAFAKPTGLPPPSVTLSSSAPDKGKAEITEVPTFEKSRFLSNSPEAWPFANPSSYPAGRLPSIKLWHSVEDGLLDVPYAQEALEMLKKKVQLQGTADVGRVLSKDFSFKGDHDEMLQLPDYWNKLLDVVSQTKLPSASR